MHLIAKKHFSLFWRLILFLWLETSLLALKIDTTVLLGPYLSLARGLMKFIVPALVRSKARSLTL
jgi:hypothetical protein